MNEKLKKVINIKSYYDIIEGYIQALDINVSDKNSVRYIFFNNIYKNLNNILNGYSDTDDENLEKLSDSMIYLYDAIRVISIRFNDDEINKKELDEMVTSQIQNFINNYVYNK